MVALPCPTNLRDKNERERVVDKGWEDGWRESRTSGSMNEWMDGCEMGKGKREICYGGNIGNQLEVGRMWRRDRLAKE